MSTAAERKDQRAAPEEVGLGSVLVSLLEPRPGDEVAFNRWYERDHFYSGCMVGAHFFAGRRFVATRRLKEARLPRQGGMLGDLRAGSYLSLYWLLAGRHDEAVRWAVDRVRALIDHDRMFAARRPIHAGFYRSCFSVSHDPDGVPPELALDHPFAGVTLTLWQASEERHVEGLAAALEGDWLPGSMFESGGPSLCLGLRPAPLPEEAPSTVARPAHPERRILVLGFHSEDPGTSSIDWTGRVWERVRNAGLGRLLLSAPFIPTVPGTDRYTDELW